MTFDVIKAAKEVHEDVIKWRRELHLIPELNFDLFKTSEYVRAKLDEFEIPYEVVAQTGIVGLITGIEDGPTIALRADMDGLEIVEDTNLAFASTNKCMHACGHDAHTAGLLGAAKILIENKHLLRGKVKLFFQPAEETVGGAKPMIEAGCMENPKVDAVIGLHVGQLFKQVKNGQVGICYGPVMAAVDTFKIIIKGKGGHAATPHLTIDPVLIGSEIVMSLQKIISREINPTQPAVVTVAELKAGDNAHNIIPQIAFLHGTVRTTSGDDREYIQTRIFEIVNGIANANRATAEINYVNNYPVVINNEEFTGRFAKIAEKVVGKENVIVIKSPSMGAEDMAYFLEKAPGTFFFLGTHNENKGINYPHHHPKFDLDEDVLWVGPALFVSTVVDYLR